MSNKTQPVDPQKIKAGFSIKSVSMGDGDSGKVMWECEDCASLINSQKSEEIKATIPKELLQCKNVSRDVTFSSVQMIKNLRLEQLVKMMGQVTEIFEFKFGFVIPESTNSWQQVIQTSDVMVPAEVLSGNLVVETIFYDGETPISSFSMRIFYV